MYPGFKKAHASSSLRFGEATGASGHKDPGLVKNVHKKRARLLSAILTHNAPVVLPFNATVPVLKQGMAPIILDGADTP